jgi:hypothetical protein
MAELKTTRNNASVSAFLDAIKDECRRADCKAVARLMQKMTGEKPKMWGTSIVGFGSYHYVYASGREGDWPITGFSPRAQALTLYIMSGFDGEPALMKKLGKYKTGKSCLYVKSLADVDVAVLEELVRRSIDFIRKKYPATVERKAGR